MSRCTINNKSIQSLRKDPVYQAVMIDLAIMGVLDRSELSTVLGGHIPSGIRLGDECIDDVIDDPDYNDTDDRAESGLLEDD